MGRGANAVVGGRDDRAASTTLPAEFALIASYELLMCRVRRVADARSSRLRSGCDASGRRGQEARVVAWQWAMANRSGDGSLPSGKDICRAHGRHERSGQLAERSGLAGGPDPQT
jgi:hypothetical protein